MADKEVKVRKERDPIFSVCFVVFVVAAAAVLGASLYDNYLKTDETMAASGNTVSVNYVGTYYAYHGESNAVVFDTSLWSVADGSAAKSNDFEARAQSKYTPLSFTVGGTDVLSMFGNAVIGHKVGDKVRVEIPVGQGYNSADTVGTAYASGVFGTVKAEQKITSAQFEKLYGYKLTALPSEDLKSPYGWPVRASYNTADDTVTVHNMPVAGQSYTAADGDYGKVTVTAASVGTEIAYRVSVSGYTVVKESGSVKEIQMIKVSFDGPSFYITSVTESGGSASSFTYKTVAERYNQILFFEIEIVTIKT
ncbi:MAG: FKBP-type peptidyl-prolyl cis-trans isomerase [Candidatus Methanoplasma sp.]|jgi:hypothetical protein|nr:FKBP-type peptidyl-prolyl cis-trans isomerase [Candidatus Methanoplasma sp.]